MTVFELYLLYFCEARRRKKTKKGKIENVDRWKILSWNIRGWETNKQHVQTVIEELDYPDILFLQETKVKEGPHRPFLHGYTTTDIPERQKVEAARGIAIAWKKDRGIEAKQIDTKDIPWILAMEISKENDLNRYVVVNVYMNSKDKENKEKSGRCGILPCVLFFVGSK